MISIQAQAVNHNMVSQLAVELIEKNPYQTRYVFSEEQLLELADSIKENGVVQPVVGVRQRRKVDSSWCWASGGCARRRSQGSERFRRSCAGFHRSRRRR